MLISFIVICTALFGFGVYATETKTTEGKITKFIQFILFVWGLYLILGGT